MLGRTFNLGLDDANLSKEELAETIKKYVPRFFIHYSEIGTDPDKRNYIVSNQSLREAGFGKAVKEAQDAARKYINVAGNLLAAKAS